MSSESGTRVYVGNLTDKIKKEDLENEFTKFGKLNSVWIAFHPPGFAFIEFENKDEADSACDGLNGQELLGTKLRVEISKGRRGGRGGGAGRFGGSRNFSGGNRDYGGRRDFNDRGYSGRDSRDSRGSGGNWRNRSRSRSPRSRF
jgi:splicing factor, arginine/serine-rich 7